MNDWIMILINTENTRVIYTQADQINNNESHLSLILLAVLKIGYLEYVGTNIDILAEQIR